jgi:tetratricopeptide (TPR) repeat protein
MSFSKQETFMKKQLIGWVLALALAAPLAAQPAQPQPKSQKEVDALMAIQNAADPDTRIAAIQTLLTDFKDTEFKEFAFYLAMISYQQKNDFENMLVFGEKTLEVNPEHVGTLVALSFAIPLRTREFDLDKEEKLSKAENYAQRALKLIPTMESPNPNTTPEEWLIAKKDMMAQTHEALGTIALTRKDYPKAEEGLRQSLQVAPEQNASTFFKLARSLKEQNKLDEALDAANKSISLGGVQTTGGQDAAKILKAEIEKLKQGPPAPAAAEGQPPQAPQVQIVQP